MRRNAFYHYKVTFFDDYTEKIVTEEGITVGTSFAEALDNVTNYYNDDVIEQVQLDCMTDYDGVIDLESLKTCLDTKGALD